jgi:hypothetical protein
MSFPITHIVLAQQALDKSKKKVNKRDFFLGVSFPDIRYLGVIDREKTHNLDHPKNDFELGMKAHSEADLFRFNFMEKRLASVKNHLEDMAIKIVEDYILYDYLDDWQQYSDYFLELIEAEKNWVDDQAALEFWHQALRKYLSQKPNDQQIKSLAAAMGLPTEFVEQLLANFHKFKDNPEVIESIQALYQEGSHSGYCISLEN